MTTIEISLEGKVALVTGIGPNIGSGIAPALARYGTKVTEAGLVSGLTGARARIATVL